MTCGDRREALLEKLARAKQSFPEKPDRSNGTEPPKRWMRIVRRSSVGEKATEWVVKYLNAGDPRVLTRIKALLSWTIRLPLQGWRLVRTYIGRRVGLDDFEKRMAVCVDCQNMQVRLIRKRPFKKLYCGSCGCPRWPLSELDRAAGDLRRSARQRRRLGGKNWLRKWECPVGKHEKLNDPPEWKDIIAKEREWADNEAG